MLHSYSHLRLSEQSYLIGRKSIEASENARIPESDPNIAADFSYLRFFRLLAIAVVAGALACHGYAVLRALANSIARAF